MKIVLDTNVFVSGVFFGGPPREILRAWRAGRFDLAISLEILEEYTRVVAELHEKHPDVDAAPFLELVALHGELVDCAPLLEGVCEDPDDDKFLACALAAGSPCVVSGDKLLLKTSGHAGIQVLSPRQFIERQLGD